MGDSSRAAGEIRYDLARNRARGLLTLTKQRPPVDVQAIIDLDGIPVVERALPDGTGATFGDVAGRRSIILNRKWKFSSENERLPMSRAQGQGRMRRATKEQGLIIRPAVAAHSDDNAQPDVTEHPYRFRMLLAALPGTQVVGLGPLTMALAGECELPHRASQGMTTGPTNMYSADGRAFPGDRRGTGFALGAARIAISVAIVAQFSDHPGGEEVASAGQAVVELAVRMESQYPLNLPIVGLEVFGKRLQLRHQRAGQSCLRADERRRDMKAAGLHLRVNLHCPVVAMGAVTAQ